MLRMVLAAQLVPYHLVYQVIQADQVYLGGLQVLVHPLVPEDLEVQVNQVTLALHLHQVFLVNHFLPK